MANTNLDQRSQTGQSYFKIGDNGNWWKGEGGHSWIDTGTKANNPGPIYIQGIQGPRGLPGRDSKVASEDMEVVENENELHTKYPKGKKGVVITRNNSHFWYYSNNLWIEGGDIIKNPTYPLLNTDGTYINLNYLETWRLNPDISSLKTGYYIAYIQTESDSDSSETDPSTVYPNPTYPVAINFPNELKGAMCSIKVIEYPNLGDDYIRADYEVWSSYSNKKWFSTKRLDGTVSDWRQSFPNQVYQLTYDSGVSPSFRKGSTDVNQINSTLLNVDITTLNSGFYIGAIDKDTGDKEGFDTIKRLNLPKDFPIGQICSVTVNRSDTNRKVIQLSALYTSATWIGTTGVNNSLVTWKRIDNETSTSELDIAEFAYQLNTKIEQDSLLFLMITDTHAQDKDLSTQKSFVNPTLFDDYEALSNYVDADYHIHLGDWIDGNNRTELSRVSMVKYTNRFYSLNNSYGIIGNHDWNGYWGEQLQDEKRLSSGYFSKKDMQRYFIPKKANTDKTYYFVDNDKHKTRTIFLNTFDVTMNESSDGKIVNSPQSQAAFTSDQVRWLISTLLSMPDDYNAIVICHAPLDNVFSDTVFFNGNTVRNILESYQTRVAGTVMESDINSSNEDYSSYKLNESYDFSESSGKILGVFNGHIHRDKSIFLNGIRYVSLLCARPEGGTDEEKPPRGYYDITKTAISAIEISKDSSTINLYRYGAGKDRVFNMFSE